MTYIKRIVTSDFARESVQEQVMAQKADRKIKQYRYGSLLASHGLQKHFREPTDPAKDLCDPALATRDRFMRLAVLFSKVLKGDSEDLPAPSVLLGRAMPKQKLQLVGLAGFGIFPDQRSIASPLKDLFQAPHWPTDQKGKRISILFHEVTQAEVLPRPLFHEPGAIISGSIEQLPFPFEGAYLSLGHHASGQLNLALLAFSPIVRYFGPIGYYANFWDNVMFSFESAALADLQK